MRSRVEKARLVQNERGQGNGFACNAHIPSGMLETLCAVTPQAKDLLMMCMKEMGLSMRAYTRILRVARTIADLAGSSTIEEEHVAEAVSYRGTNEKYWK